MAGLTALLGALGAVLGGQSGMMMALVFAVAMNVFMYFTSHKMVLRMYRAEVVDAARALSSTLIDRLRQKADCQCRRSRYATRAANAFATGLIRSTPSSA